MGVPNVSEEPSGVVIVSEDIIVPGCSAGDNAAEEREAIEAPSQP